MIPVNIRKQGGAAIVTIPSDLMRQLDLDIGDGLELEVAKGVLTATPVKQVIRRRYTLAELLKGATRARMAALNAETEWAREGGPVGRELA